MSREQIFDFIPEIQRSLLPSWFSSPLPEERHATCGACAMCAPAEPVLPAKAYFSPDTKCCTFHPSLPNYAVGGLLCDESEQGAEGRARIERKIAAREGVTPLGIAPSARYALLYRQGVAGFGRARALVCPYLDTSKGACTVWAQRDAVCATWFCKYNDGKDGYEFWKQLRAYLLEVQNVLATVALSELGWDPDRIALDGRTADRLDERDLDDRGPSDEAYAASWGEWLGRERDLFVTCYRVVRDLGAERFARHAGIHHDVALARLKLRYAQMREPTLPDPLLRNPSMRVQRMLDGSYLLTSYGAGDRTRLRAEVYALLDEFDGHRSTAEVLAAIGQRTAHRVSTALLLALYKHRVLVDPASVD